MNRPTEKKVIASTGGSAAGVTVSAFLLWLLDQFWFPGESDIPVPVEAMVFLVVTSGMTYGSGWLAREKRFSVKGRVLNEEAFDEEST